MTSSEQAAVFPDAMIFSKNSVTTVIDSPARIEILKILVEGDQRFDELVKRLNKAKSTISVHLHDLIDAGILAERTDETDARRKYISLDCEYLGTIEQSDSSIFSDYRCILPVTGQEPMRPASVFRMIFNSVRTSLLQKGVNVEPVLFSAGFMAGEEIAKLVSADSMDKFLDNLYDFFLKNELGEITVEKKGGPWVITVRNCYECQELPKINRPACYFDSGMLSALFSIQTGEDITAKETNCYAMGDPFCRFVIERVRE
ncbi:putative hydrocarbon binding protein [Methanomicrobium sp. W14]|uniref:V4R domain-containing protein n=1 Tax=Methanomicrobium sp. W14 TaxID=2817839 RepID=UPI001AE1D47E|nr:V4R domain-containing protein [Methanomicrobium sp. W14]MBP2134114.1 putative hydrocarbon binding protein [Methanomicrobium sp. W14]